jgi:hypothetical protein
LFTTHPKCPLIQCNEDSILTPPVGTGGSLLHI